MITNTYTEITRLIIFYFLIRRGSITFADRGLDINYPSYYYFRSPRYHFAVRNIVVRCRECLAMYVIRKAGII